MAHYKIQVKRTTHQWSSEYGTPLVFAVKIYRYINQCGLKEAKDAVESQSRFEFDVPITNNTPSSVDIHNFIREQSIYHQPYTAQFNYVPDQTQAGTGHEYIHIEKSADMDNYTIDIQLKNLTLKGLCAPMIVDNIRRILVNM